MLFVICDSHRLVAVAIVCFFNTPGCTISFMNSPNFLLVISKYHWKHPVALVATTGTTSQTEESTHDSAATSTFYTILHRHTVPNELIFPTDWSLSVFIVCFQVQLVFKSSVQFPVGRNLLNVLTYSA